MIGTIPLSYNISTTNFCSSIFFQESKELTSSVRWRFLPLSFHHDLFLNVVFFSYGIQPGNMLSLFMFNVLFAISKAVTMFENDERFKAVERARDREDLFENYIVELERKVTDCCFKLSHMSSRDFLF